jgi:hypothetical protein
MCNPDAILTHVVAEIFHYLSSLIVRKRCQRVMGYIKIGQHYREWARGENLAGSDLQVEQSAPLRPLVLIANVIATPGRRGCVPT